MPNEPELFVLCDECFLPARDCTCGAEQEAVLQTEAADFQDEIDKIEREERLAALLDADIQYEPRSAF